MKKTTLALSLLLLAGCSNDKPAEKAEITVSAAASLKDALSVIEKNYEKDYDVDIKFNYGASGSLANQIKAGAPVDLFFSAAQSKVDDLVKAGTVKKENQQTILENKLVIVSKSDVKDLNSLKQASIKKIAVGTPETVPAGAYAKEALTKADTWQDVQKKIVFTKDVRQALTYVESGNTDAGIVYATDAKGTQLKQTDIQDALHSPITYPLALIKDNQSSHAFYDYLQSDAAKKVYQSYGFNVK
ncbi:molybdate ABC transporter substrate-binding protein [Macrococcus brunensis]|uniref:molybdate ABC transporter substrate-binding protein n=1 Tax=Macrococcus brunensis TaxID=198483 RepID=UPI001EF0A030|nr:molybdate ABC transporter substrate-binding protein [Macrococcus brunensis]ULG74331.1 molybdate ABC transporter substrate-binding protein [Macrococcus brunensis]